MNPDAPRTLSGNEQLNKLGEGLRHQYRSFLPRDIRTWKFMTATDGDTHLPIGVFTKKHRDSSRATVHSDMISVSLKDVREILREHTEMTQGPSKSRAPTKYDGDLYSATKTMSAIRIERDGSVSRASMLVEFGELVDPSDTLNPAFIESTTIGAFVTQSTTKGRFGIKQTSSDIQIRACNNSGGISDEKLLAQLAQDYLGFRSIKPDRQLGRQIVSRATVQIKQ